MSKKFIIVLLFLLFVQPTFADFRALSGNPRLSNNFNSKLRINRPNIIASGFTKNKHPVYKHRHHCPSCMTSDYYLSRNDLNALENYALNRTYTRENSLRRLERLENLTFGAIQEGDLISRYNNVESAILSRPRANTKQSIINNIANYLTGVPTGFTPNIMPYSSMDNFGGLSTNPSMYSPKYTNTKFEQYSNGIFGGGWGMSNGNFGTGSSVRILD